MNACWSALDTPPYTSSDISYVPCSQTPEDCRRLKLFFIDLFGCFGVKSCQKSANNNGIGGAIREPARPGNRFPDRALLLSLYWSGQRAGDGCRGGCGGPWSSRKAVQTFQIPAGGAEAQPWVTVHIWVTAPHRASKTDDESTRSAAAERRSWAMAESLR